MRNPFSSLTKFEWILYSVSLFLVTLSFVFSKSGTLSFIASLIGVTALIFVAKGDVYGQVLTVVFSLFYAYISFDFRYFGEMITYLGMTAPIAVMAVVSWLRHPYNGTKEVKVNNLGVLHRVCVSILTVIVTVLFYFILSALDTPNLFFSTVSVTTSFLASSLTFLRSPAYALAYAANDIVLIILWILASLSDISYLPMIICFAAFLLNDIYAFINWTKMKKRQSS